MGAYEVKKLYIDIFNLQNKSYDYDFAIDDRFFQSFEDSFINKGRATIKVSLSKSETFIEVSIHIDGIVELTCDRSLEKFDYPVALDPKLIFKFGHEEKELDDFMIQITRQTERIDLGQYIYEFISLALPMKKLHPRFMDAEEDGDSLVYSSEASESAGEGIVDPEQMNEDDIDPRWKKLIELKNIKR